MLVDWLVSVHEEETGVHFYRGGAGPDRASVIEGDCVVLTRSEERV